MNYLLQYEPVSTVEPRWEWRIYIASDTMARDYARRLCETSILPGPFVLWRMDRDEGRDGTPIARYTAVREAREELIATDKWGYPVE